jgi:hypothetical protein
LPFTECAARAKLAFMAHDGASFNQEPNPPMSGRPKGRFAPFAPPLMSNVRHHRNMAGAGLTMLFAAGAAAMGVAVLRATVGRRAEHDGEFTVLRYGLALRVFAACSFAIPLLLTYAAFRYAANRSPGMAFAVFFFVLSWILIQETFGVQIAFDEMAIHTRSPWRRTRTIPWTDVTSISFSPGLDWYVLHTKSHGNVRAHTGLRGLPELLRAATVHIP